MLTAFTPIGQIKSLEQRLQLWAKVFEASSESIAIAVIKSMRSHECMGPA